MPFLGRWQARYHMLERVYWSAMMASIGERSIFSIAWNPISAISCAGRGLEYSRCSVPYAVNDTSQTQNSNHDCYHVPVEASHAHVRPNKHTTGTHIHPADATHATHVHGGRLWSLLVGVCKPCDLVVVRVDDYLPTKTHRYSI